MTDHSELLAKVRELRATFFTKAQLNEELAIFALDMAVAIEAQAAEIARLRKELAESYAVSDVINGENLKEIDAQDAEIEELKEHSALRGHDIITLGNEIAAKDKEIERLRSIISHDEIEINRLRAIANEGIKIERELRHASLAGKPEDGRC